MTFLQSLQQKIQEGQRLLAILIDPEKFETEQAPAFMRTLPVDTTHIFVGGSTVPEGRTEAVVEALKGCTSKPIFIFPGDYNQIADNADALLFLSLLSGRNPEYLIGQQVKAVAKLREAKLEVIPTGYILIDGGNESAVQRVTGTAPLSQENIQEIVDTAKAGELMGAQWIYLEAGSGAQIPVSQDIIKAVKADITVPLIVGGGIRSEIQKVRAYNAGADMVVMGTIFEKE
ncbi:geranylgeranylglyceryl/heptaprenylglyceryl phosphate synthase [Aureisphaera galaxeae]|uniref:geranylgeranylglyceryl/heptaprenylglyceryl phosphate synthase n=1 Tax=Aureisphaera galaxeae TaxID=1538023 RepID=UPI002350A659|nr:geranylgeranylglyceryl/heptaprenylglyceryl phosphate synthase [Aureisphaera galaxeae]MDC8002745.1 geranylgeranylglyceryl/heptaprenylglyceryl phosphate synthase [Aureisphaera galaxeae]